MVLEVEFYVTFTPEGQAHGSGGCNRFSGGYTLAGKTLNIGPLATTKMACVAAVMEQGAGSNPQLQI